ncbi:hypothetical protein BP6252_11817 [Coleophoma cylindrospora]|uniref:Translation initiation factor 5A C-terminal domain-containing protein n=1 Tax=Coleophoma cylindrospora TaxID=1849047 RepID=A0A3D8QLP4_9HELO|nr:hypothetical protein BP6252_11817 [Coleophoma cylindrospora]
MLTAYRSELETQSSQSTTRCCIDSVEAPSAIHQAQPWSSEHVGFLEQSVKLTTAKKRIYTLSSLFFPPKKQEIPSCVPFGKSKGIREDVLSHLNIVNLDFDARVPIPFSVFPSSYRSDAQGLGQQITETHVEGEIRLPGTHSRVGREGQYSSVSAHLPPRRDQREEWVEERVEIREEDHHHRPSRREDIYIREEHRPDHKHTSTHIDVELPQHHHRRHYDAEVVADTHVDLPRHRQQHFDTEIDITEREYRSRFQPTYREELRVTGQTVDAPHFRPSYQEEVRVTEQTIDPPRTKHNKMGYYDEDGHYHSFRHGAHKVAERIIHPIHGGHSHHHEDIDITVHREAPARSSAPSTPPNTVTIPTHHIRLGDLLILQGRPCQVIRITTSSATGQHRYLGVDLFTKQLHEESSFISNPSPSVVVQTMLGPVFKQYRVLDLQDGTIVAMTETGDVKQNLPVIDQSNLWSRLTEAFETGRGSVRVLVINDHGRELAVDLKVIHGSRL